MDTESTVDGAHVVMDRVGAQGEPESDLFLGEPLHQTREDAELRIGEWNDRREPRLVLFTHGVRFYSGVRLPGSALARGEDKGQLSKPHVLSGNDVAVLDAPLLDERTIRTAQIY